MISKNLYITIGQKILILIATMQEKNISIVFNSYNARTNINIVYGYLQCKKKYNIVYEIYNARTNINIVHG